MQTIAVVGMACRYPDARSPQELWENVLAQRRAFRKIPKQRLNLDYYYHPDQNVPDRTYSSQGAFLTNYLFDREHFRISGKTYRSSDLAHWLALDTAEQALADAGFFSSQQLPTASTGVLVGNTLTGEFSRAQTLRLRWPYVARVVTHALQQEQWQTEHIHHFLQALEEEYKRPFAPVGEETLAGSLSNTIAGRICNYFNLQGGGYTVDGACSSSLLAIIQACKALETFDVDVVLAGGVDLSVDPFEIIGFAKTAALASEEMRVYDVHSRGFLPGEGCGFLVLMRYEEARARGCQIYATMRGWGISSDGSGGITRPEVEGQYLALERAYRHAGVRIDAVPYFEGHGTGTSVGDATELQALTFARAQITERHRVEKAAISSVKANIGHTKAAAGVAGVIKAIMAVYRQIIPPTTGVVEPHRELTRSDAQIQIVRQGKRWPVDLPLVAGVSSMGFGGINAHIVLENPASERREALTPFEEALLTSFQDAELFLLSASDTEQLQEQIAHLLTLAPRLSLAELTDLAAHLVSQLQVGAVRAALVASKPPELTQRLEQLQELLASGVSTHIDREHHLYLGSGTKTPCIALLFPGQGAPAHRDGGILRSTFSMVDTLYQQAALPVHGDGKQTEIAQPAITTASLAGQLLLERLHIQTQLALGHSLGELNALHWAGVIDSSALLRIARARGEAMARIKGQDGAMLSIRADTETVKALLHHTPVVIAGINSPRQTVVSGDILSVNTVAARARARGLASVPLAVSHAFHSLLVAPAVPTFAEYLKKEQFQSPQRTMVSTVTGDFLADEDIVALLCQQITGPVRFIEAVERIQESVDLFIEVGPGRTLSGLVSDITSKPVVTIDAGGASIKGLLSAAAAAFVLGAPVETQALFAHRFARPFDLNWNPSFLANPCEEAPVSDIEPGELLQASQAESEEPLYSRTASTFALVQQLIAARAELPADIIGPDSKMLSDLHLNSLTVGHIFAEASRALGIAPSVSLLKYADASLDEIVQTLEDLRQQAPLANERAHSRVPEGLAEWVRCFEVYEKELPPVALSSTQGDGNWHIVAPENYTSAPGLISTFAHVKCVGSLVCLPVELDQEAVSLLLQEAQAVLVRQECTHFVLIQHGEVGAAFARALALEYPHLTVCVFHVSELHVEPLLATLAAEVMAANRYVEVHYPEPGVRAVPMLRAYAPISQGEQIRLQADDVVLVTGGGKGIAAECSLALAVETGVGLALFGRSDPQNDADLAAHLTRLNLAGVRYCYLAVDVQDQLAVDQAIKEIEASLGPVTALLHAAGSNQPTLLSKLDDVSMQRVLAPKVSGLQNLLAALTPQRLKYLITFGSVIARTGMHGEAHYALANEWLAHLTEAFQRRNPATACLCIEWSVWSDVGMGKRLGSVETLRAEDITPIPPEKGVELFLQLLAYRQQTTRIVVAGRLGETPTLKREVGQLPFLRFLEKPLVFYPGVELITEAAISLETDPYLDDHQLQNERLVPAVVGMEAMAQLAQAVTGEQSRPAFHDLQFLRPLIVTEQKSLTLRLLALVQDDGQVKMAVRSSESAYQVDHFHALCDFGQIEHPETSFPQWLQAGQNTIPLQIPQDLYGSLLFHQGRFQRLARYTLLHAWECVAEITPCPDSSWFGYYLPQALVLGDFAERDAFIHAIQACIPQATVLPVGVESVIFAPQTPPDAQSVQVYARERERHGNTFIYDIEVRQRDGAWLERWQGLHLQIVEQKPPSEEWALAILGPYLERRLADLTPLARPRCELFSSQEDVVSAEVSVEAASEWHGLFNTGWQPIVEQLQAESGDDFACSLARVQAASKLLTRAGFALDTPFVLHRNEQDGWQVLQAGSLLCATFVARLRSLARPLVFAFAYSLTPGHESHNLIQPAERR